MAADLESVIRSSERTPAVGGRIAALVLVGLLGCSARDLSGLYNGIRPPNGGTAGVGGTISGGSAGEAGAGGSAGEAGAGGSADEAGAGGSADEAGAGGTAGETDVGGTAGKTNTGGTAGGPPVNMVLDLGPWSFNSEKEALNGQWTVNTSKTSIAWTGEGIAPPLGSLVLDGTSLRIRGILHPFGRTEAGTPNLDLNADLSAYKLHALARAATSDGTLALFAADNTYARTTGPTVALSTDWQTVEYALNTPDVENPTYNPTRIAMVGINAGTSAVWIDRVWLAIDAPDAPDAGSASPPEP